MLFRISRQRKIMANGHFEHKLSKWVYLSMGVKEKGCLGRPEMSEYCFKLVYSDSGFNHDQWNYFRINYSNFQIYYDKHWLQKKMVESRSKWTKIIKKFRNLRPFSENSSRFEEKSRFSLRKISKIGRHLASKFQFSWEWGLWVTAHKFVKKILGLWVRL